MWKTIIALGVLFLTGCNPSYDNKEGSYTLPPEMRDCSIYRLNGSMINRDLVVVRCPNSQTTTTSKVGRSSAQSVTVINEGY
nr:hypothetical protein [Citrobacter freundii]